MSNTVQMPLGSINVVGDESVGQIGCFSDLDRTTNPESPRRLSNLKTYAVLVKNDLGGVVTPGLGYTYKSGYLGTRVGALSGADLVCDGIADPDYPTTIPDQSYFWLIIQGPTKAKIGAGDQAANGVVQTLANGLFGTGTAGTNPIGHSGKALAAAAATALCRILFNNPFSAVKP